MGKNLKTYAVLLTLLAGILTAAWHVTGWPPPWLVAKYGLPPAGGPTGRKLTVEGIEFIELSRGYYLMGSSYYIDRGFDDSSEGDSLGRLAQRLGLPLGEQPFSYHMELPQRWIEISTPFWCAVTEVTRGQYRRSGAPLPRGLQPIPEDCPVDSVTLDQAIQFTEWILRQSGLFVRLPLEVEWEYAARAGSRAEFCFGDDPGLLEAYGWFDMNADRQSHPVGSQTGEEKHPCFLPPRLFLPAAAESPVAVFHLLYHHQ